MAITVKYRMDWKDQFQGDDFRVDFEMEYGGSIIGLGHSANSGFELNYNDEEWVVGSEAVISFLVTEDDIVNYDIDFYTSIYKDVKVKFYINTVLKWVGWLKPENTTREFLYPEVEYRVSATDGLNDLLQVDYTGFENTGKEDLLQIIKNAIDFIGITDFDFFIQCNLYEDILMSATQNVFKQLEVSNEGFYDVKDGELVPDKCYTVLEKCISSFYCRLYQSDGFWKIVNGQEYNSQSDTYAYSTLNSIDSNVAYDRQVDITNYHRPAESKFELSKKPTLKNLRIIYRNKNLGGNEIATNPDFEDGGNPPPGYANSGWDQFITTTEDGNKVGNTTEITDNSDIKYISPNSFTLASVDVENDVLLVSFKVKLKSITLSSGSEFPMVYPSLIDPNSIEVKAFPRYINEIDGEFVVIEHSFNLTVNGTYTLRLYVEPRSPTSQVTYYWDDVKVVHQATINTTNDSLYVVISSVVGYAEKELTLYFLDTLQVSDIGALLFGGVSLTKSWTRHGFSAENSTLPFLFAQQYLNDLQAFHDLLKIDLYDIDEQLTFNSILTYNSKKYRFLEYSKDYKTKIINATLIQVDNSSDISFQFRPQSLTSSFGHSSPLVAVVGFATQTWALAHFPEIAANEIINGLWDFIHATGLKVGGVAFKGTDITNWNTAFSWGDHGVEGYITAVAMDDLTDAITGSETEGQVLTWTSGVWRNADAQGGSAHSLTSGTHTDVTYPNTPVSGDILVNTAGPSPAWQARRIHLVTTGGITGGGNFLWDGGDTRLELTISGSTFLTSVNNSNWSGEDLSVANGGTGASVLTGLLSGNGTSPITGNRTINNDNWAGQDLVVANGGTGASSFGTDNILLGSGTSPIHTVGQNTGFNKSFGTGAGNVAEGNHNHNAVYVNISGDTMIGDLIAPVIKITNWLRFDTDKQLRFGTAGTDWHLFTTGNPPELHFKQGTQGADTGNDLFILTSTNAKQFQFDVSAGDFHANGDVIAFSTSLP